MKALQLTMRSGNPGKPLVFSPLAVSYIEDMEGAYSVVVLPSGLRIPVNEPFDVAGTKLEEALS